jgi:hypothetical protein
MFRKLACVVAICAVLPLGGAYASEPRYSDHHASEPAVSADAGRIYFYRESSFAGLLVEAAIKVDGVTVGQSSSGEYFYVDRPPGTYAISATTEKEEDLSVTLAAGQIVYVRTHPAMGLFIGHIIPEIVADDRGTSEINDCHYAGTDTPVAPAAAPGMAPAMSATPAAPAATPASAPATTAAPAATPATDAPAQTPPKN